MSPTPEERAGDESSGEGARSELVAARRAKAARLREAGIDPFPHLYSGVTSAASVRDAHPDLVPGEETATSYRVAGRLAARRGQGRAAFLDIVDRSGRLQLHAREDVLGAERFGTLTSLDLGDLLGVDGSAFMTRRGELSLRVEDFQILAKSLAPPPDKHHGLTDVETRYRRRELDLLANEDTRRLFIDRARIVSAIRGHLDAAGFVELETPVLQPLYGGALARPFTTHHNALGRELFLRIAPELYLKRAIVGGLERVYELGKDFRNEGLDPKHNPEFTMVEWYEAYADYEDEARRVEELVAAVATAVGYAGPLDFRAPWRRVRLGEAILAATGLDVLALRERDALAAAVRASSSDVEVSDRSWPQLVDDLFSRHVEPGLIAPTFVLDYPIESSPFAKAHRSQAGLAERFEAFAGGMEIANAFTELNDPDEQRRRFEAQVVERADGDEETQPYDEGFIAALEQGMPPTGGVGLGVDRLVMLLTGRQSIREVVLFPAMR